MKIFVQVILLILAILTAAFAYGDEGCTFAGDSIKEPYFAKGLVASKTWDNKLKEYRAILNGGAMLFIAYSHCDHFGMQANLILTTDEIDPKVLAQRADWFASVVLNKNDLANFRKGIKGKELGIGANITIDNADYDDFGVEVTAQGALTIITISYYFT